MKVGPFGMPASPKCAMRDPGKEVVNDFRKLCTFIFVFIQDVSEVKEKMIEALSRSLSMVAAVYELAELMNSQMPVAVTKLTSR